MVAFSSLYGCVGFCEDEDVCVLLLEVLLDGCEAGVGCEGSGEVPGGDGHKRVGGLLTKVKNGALPDGHLHKEK